MIPLSVPEIEGGSPERDGGGEGEEEEEGLVWADSSSWIYVVVPLSNVHFHNIRDPGQSPLAGGQYQRCSLLEN